MPKKVFKNVIERPALLSTTGAIKYNTDQCILVTYVVDIYLGSSGLCTSSFTYIDNVPRYIPPINIHHVKIKTSKPTNS